MQEGADRKRRRSRARPRSCCASRAAPRRQGRGSRGGRRRRRRVSRARRARPARWSRSIAKPTSSRATRTSSRSRRSSRSWSREKNPADVAALVGAAARSAALSSRVRQALVQKIGENMSIRRFVRFATPARLVQYLHGGGRVGVTVEFEGGDEQVGKDVAMHIAATTAPATCARSACRAPRCRPT